MTLWTIARFIPIARPRADGTGPLTLTGRWTPQPDRWGTFPSPLEAMRATLATIYGKVEGESLRQAPADLVRAHWRRAPVLFGLKLVRHQAVSATPPETPRPSPEPKPRKAARGSRTPARGVRKADSAEGPRTGEMPAGPASRSTPASREGRYAPGTSDDGLRQALLSGMPPAMRAKVSEAVDAVDRALAPARARFLAADPGSRALRPAELDWAEPAELDWAEPAELEALAAAHAGLRRDSFESAKLTTGEFNEP